MILIYGNDIVDKELQIINNNGQLLVDSREVAEVTGKRHSDLLDSIGGYIKHLLSGNFRSVNFFIESTYIDSTGRELPCYLLTRIGCDMVANKMTGEKGVLFTTAYGNKFKAMEEQLKLNTNSRTYSDALRALIASIEEKDRHKKEKES
jgi:Rha family phage regulatory protein